MKPIMILDWKFFADQVETAPETTPEPVAV
jgi:hypothetical protein